MREEREMTDEKVSEKLITFIRNQFLDGDPGQQLDASTPLLEWGVLNSLNTVQLLTYIRDEFGVRVPPTEISARGFKDVNSITALVTDHAGANA
jgi:acyl carrier protein